MPRLETAASRSIISSSTSSSSGHRPQCGQACTQRHFTAGGPSRRHHDRRSTQGAMRHTKSRLFAASSIAFYQKRIDRKILFLHAREDKDIAWIKEYCHKKGIYCKTIKVDRKVLDKNSKYGNHADDDVYNFGYDLIIENNGTLDDLRDSAVVFLDSLFKDEEHT